MPSPEKDLEGTSACCDYAITISAMWGIAVLPEQRLSLSIQVFSSIWKMQTGGFLGAVDQE